MKSIYKYRLSLTDKQELLIPDDPIPLSVQVQKDELCVWMVVDTNAPMKPVTVYIAGTGYEIKFDPAVALYIGTVQMSNGALVWHVFMEDEHSRGY